MSPGVIETPLFGKLGLPKGSFGVVPDFGAAPGIDEGGTGALQSEHQKRKRTMETGQPRLCRGLRDSLAAPLIGLPLPAL
jgi:hypothetical protein